MGGEGIRACIDDKISILLVSNGDTSSDLADHFSGVDDFLAFHMAASFREDLILDVHPGDPHVDQAFRDPRCIDCIAPTRIDVCHNGYVDRL